MIVLLGFSTAAAAQTSRSYIEKYKDAAIEAMEAHGVPASIILGVAMHESGNGTSKIARYLNNHFGIKGKNNSTKINSAYKGYGSVEESYNDFINLLQRRSQYSWLFEHAGGMDYRSWILAMQRGGYAQSKTWASRVIATIKKFKLYEFDKQVNSDTRTASAIPATLMAPGKEKPAAPASEPETVYTVQKGDTLFDLARRYQTSIKEIKQANGLKSSLLRPGQKLKL